MVKLLPDKVVWRKKTGFGAPIHSWISGSLRSMFMDYLSEERIRRQGIFNFEYIEKLLKDEFSNAEYFSNHLWQLFIFQIWHEKFIVN